MSKARARLATACPILPSPMMPSRLSSSLRPMSCMGCQPPHFLSFRSRSPSGARRAEPRMSSIAISAVGDGDGVWRVRHPNAPRLRRRKVDMLKPTE